MRGNAIIVGAGIGGLASGLALEQDGWDVEIHERADALRETGAALMMAPNAMAALGTLGVEERVLGKGVVIRRGEIRRGDGRLLKRIDLADTHARLGHATVVVSRPALHAALRDALGTARVRTSSRVEHASPERAEIVLEGGARVAADALVGADGAGSVLARVLHGERPSRPSGVRAWRGVAPDPGDVVAADMATQWWGDLGEAGAAPCGDGMIYWFATAPDGVPLERALASLPPEFRALALSTRDVREDALRDRAPIAAWGRGRATLLGDAAHLMLPHAGQGAAQALEDAVTLAAMLRRHDEVEPALRAYERTRIPRANGMVERSRQNGRMTGLRSGFARAARDALIRMMPASMVARQMAGVARWTPPS